MDGAEDLGLGVLICRSPDERRDIRDLHVGLPHIAALKLHFRVR